jgi:hypothetical protein
MLRRVRRNPVVDQVLLTGFRTVQRTGFNIVPNHYYWPIPDLDALEARPRQTFGESIDFHFDEQIAIAEQMGERCRAECVFPTQETEHAHEFHLNNGMFESVDAEVAHCMVRQFRPRRIIEIGGGNSTRIFARAALMNREEYAPCDLITIEPFPSPALRDGFPGMSELVHRPVQDVELGFFDQLGNNDILFIDSSHVVAIGSDVVYEFLKIIPRLKPGVIIHVHDIFTPSDYPHSTVFKSLCFWSEQYLLESMMTMGDAFRVIWASSAMQIEHADVLCDCFPSWQDSYARMPRQHRRFIPSADGRNVWPSSWWMRKVR